MKTLRHATLVLLLGSPLLAGSGCDSTKVQPAGNGGASGSGIAGTSGTAGTSGLGGAGGVDGAGGVGGGIPLVDWVTDLTDNHTNDVSPPDTVADKNIIDTADPTAFDPLLSR